ncbi:hypothetical protein NM688_g1759 [Phlebia brevispora]|uniref:Uncharacterized protein n=1 Tax=Phlebia brevispora TaxID=194682 RepID=A0ACC1TAK8_9APHY|nr:hypothetical protein NM688_g1759 [Phlebia brevispora]
MPSHSPPMAICTCSKCIKYTTIDPSGYPVCGVLQTLAVIKYHTRQDATKDIDEDTLTRKVFRAALAPPIHDDVTLSVRSQDVNENSEGEVEKLVDSEMEVNSGNTAESSVTTADPQEPYQVLSVLESSLVHKSRLIAQMTSVAFSTVPTAVDDPALPLDESNLANVDICSMSQWLSSNMDYIALQEDTNDLNLIGRR